MEISFYFVAESLDAAIAAYRQATLANHMVTLQGVSLHCLTLEAAESADLQTGTAVWECQLLWKKNIDSGEMHEFDARAKGATPVEALATLKKNLASFLIAELVESNDEWERRSLGEWWGKEGKAFAAS